MDLTKRESMGNVQVYVSIPSKGGFHLFPGIGGGNIVTMYDTNPSGSQTGWIRVDHIVPLFSQNMQGGRGQATFNIKRYTHYDSAYPQAQRPQSIDLQARQWICICAADKLSNATPNNIPAVKWWGFIRNTDSNPYDGQLESNGSAFAAEYGSLLDEVPLFGFKDASGRVLQSPPTFNFKQGNALIGNFTPDPNNSTGNTGAFTLDPTKLVMATYFKDKAYWPSDKSGVATPPAQGAWTRLRVLNHVLSNCVPAALPPLDISVSGGNSQDDATAAMNALNDAKPEMFNLEYLTIGSALDLLISPGRGLQWNMSISSSSSIDIIISTTSPIDIKGGQVTNGAGSTVYIPHTTPHNLLKSDFLVKKFVYQSQDTRDRTDKIIVEGNRIVCCASIRGPGFDSTDYTLDAAWAANATNQPDGTPNPVTSGGVLFDPTPNNTIFSITNYNDPNSLKNKNNIGYSALEYLYVTGDGPKSTAAQNRTLRAQPWLKDVFTHYRMRIKSGILRRISDPTSFGSGVSSQELKAYCPLFSWDGQTVTYMDSVETSSGGNIANHSTPSISNLRILNWIPWIVSTTIDPDSGNLIDNRNAIQQANMQFSAPLVFQYRNGVWINVNEPGASNALGTTIIPTATPTLAMDDRVGTFNIAYTFPELAAQEEYRIYENAKDPTTNAEIVGTSEVDPTVDANAGSWRNFMCTFAVESDQRVRVVKYNPNMQYGSQNDAIVGRIIRVYDDNLNCYFLPKGTVIGIGHTSLSLIDPNTPAVPLKLVNDIFLRNDFPLCERIATEISAWAFRQRQVMALTLARPDLLPGAGQLWSGSMNADPASVSPQFAYLGSMIGTVTDENDNVFTFNTPIRSIEVDWTLSSPSVTIATAFPPMPEFDNVVNMQGGQATSPSLGGAIVQVVQKLKKDVQEQQVITQKMPLTSQTSPGADWAATSTYGTVYGGNANISQGNTTPPPMFGDPSLIYPANKPFIFNLMPNEDPASPPKWTDYWPLPATFEHGDNIAQAFPPGVGIVRLGPESDSYGTASWDADLQTIGNPNDDPTSNVVTMVQMQIRNGSQLWVYWSEAVTDTNSYSHIPVSEWITLNTDGGSESAGALTVQSEIGTSTNITKFNLSRTVNADETVTVTSYFAGLVMDAQGNRNTNALTPANTPVTFSQARFCYVLVINRDSNSGYPAGKMVTLRDNGFTLSDQQSGTKQITYPLLDLLPMGGIPTGPQRHLNDSPGVIGGGYSFATPLPTDYPTMVTLNLQDLFRTAPDQ